MKNLKPREGSLCFSLWGSPICNTAEQRADMSLHAFYPRNFTLPFGNVKNMCKPSLCHIWWQKVRKPSFPCLTSGLPLSSTFHHFTYIRGPSTVGAGWRFVELMNDFMIQFSSFSPFWSLLPKYTRMWLYTLKIESSKLLRTTICQVANLYPANVLKC